MGNEEKNDRNSALSMFCVSDGDSRPVVSIKCYVKKIYLYVSWVRVYVYKCKEGVSRSEIETTTTIGWLTILSKALNLMTKMLNSRISESQPVVWIAGWNSIYISCGYGLSGTGGWRRFPRLYILLFYN